MPKTPRTRAHIQRKYGRAECRPLTRGRARGRNTNQDELERNERIAAVGYFFCKGYSVREIQEAMRDKFGEAGEMTREAPYAILAYAASKGWFRLRPPYHLEYRLKLLDHYDWLQRVEVVQTPIVQHVAEATADQLLQMIQEFHQKHGKDEVHVGFAGGLSMRSVAAAFAESLGEPVENLPAKIVIHAMVSGFDPNHPSTDPNAFFTYYMNQPLREVEIEFVGLRSPAIMKAGEFVELKKQSEIAQAFEAAGDLDIIVTSGAEWDDPDGQLQKGLASSADSVQILEDEGCVGDILWRPLGPNGPIETPTPHRAMTLCELSALPEFVERGGRVLLMLGSCGGCQRPKGRLLQTILDLPEHLVTDLVVDTPSAAEVMRAISTRRAA